MQQPCMEPSLDLVPLVLCNAANIFDLTLMDVLDVTPAVS